MLAGRPRQFELALTGPRRSATRAAVRWPNAKPRASRSVAAREVRRAYRAAVRGSGSVKIRRPHVA